MIMCKIVVVLVVALGVVDQNPFYCFKSPEMHKNITKFDANPQNVKT